MTRDLDLIRLILFRVEQASDMLHVRDLEDLGQYPLHTIATHVEWLAEGGLLTVEYLFEHTAQMAYDGIILRQTWQGCEFLDAARSEQVWNHAKRLLQNTTISASLKTLHILLDHIVASQLLAEAKI